MGLESGQKKMLDLQIDHKEKHLFAQLEREHVPAVGLSSLVLMSKGYR